MTKRSLRAVVFHFVLLVSFGFMTSCGGGSSSTPVPPPAKAQLLYATTTSISGLTITTQFTSFKLNSATGDLSAGATGTLSDFVSGLAVDPATKFLYASTFTPPGSSINTFAVASDTGNLQPTNAFFLNPICALCPIPSSPGELALAPGGRTLYYGSATPVLGTGIAQGIGALKVGSGGNPTVVPGSPFPADLIPLSVAVHPSGKFLYTANVGPFSGVSLIVQSISCFAIDPATGALSPTNSPVPVAGPNNASAQNLLIHPSGKYLYLTTGSAANGVLGWSIDPTSGSLTALGGSPFAPGTFAGGGVFESAGLFLYSAGAGGTISTLSADPASGTLTMVGASQPVTGANFSVPVIDASGTFLFAGDGPQNSIVGFRLNTQTGGLTMVGTPASIGGVPGMLAIVNAP